MLVPLKRKQSLLVRERECDSQDGSLHCSRMWRSKSEKHKGVGFFRIPSVITTQGQEFEDITTERRERWISAISRDDTRIKDVLESERVCGRHFVSGKPAQSWDKHNVDWIPTLNLGKKIYKEKNVEAAAERAVRAKARRKSAIERQEQEGCEEEKTLEPNWQTCM